MVVLLITEKKIATSVDVKRWVGIRVEKLEQIRVREEKE